MAELSYEVKDRKLVTPCPFGVRTADRVKVVEVASSPCSFCPHYGGWLHGLTIDCKHPPIKEGEKHKVEVTAQYAHYTD